MLKLTIYPRTCRNSLGWDRLQHLGRRDRSSKRQWAMKDRPNGRRDKIWAFHLLSPPYSTCWPCQVGDDSVTGVMRTMPKVNLVGGFWISVAQLHLSAGQIGPQ